ncbi:MAG: NAD(P)-binding domain-containing protein [Alphaproteobacteria bacterium]|jgi:3-hydroxyisobutyrate dehydrogenase-like beta-hydroxyacid dehydrogenase|nr:NAD(P)-binding domain-containing protein [Alphaproteobacteria bacterium]
MTPTTIALLGFGEAGTAIGRGLVEDCGWLAEGRQLVVIDIALDAGEAGQAMRRRAEDLGIDIHVDYGPHLASADVVISVVTGDQARNAAAAAAAHLRPEAVYLDFNSITRSMTEANAEALAPSGANFIDIAVMGSFHAYGQRVPLLVAGEDAGSITQWLCSLGFLAKVLGPVVGTASAVKILRSILMKGLEALGVEFMVAARHQGLLEEALACTADVDIGGFRHFLELLTTTHLVHAKRRHEEVELVNRMLRESGMEPLMSLATERALFRTLATGATRPGGPVPSLDEALQTLADHVVRPKA